jgi:hypothetical protein
MVSYLLSDYCFILLCEARITGLKTSILMGGDGWGAFLKQECAVQIYVAGVMIG